MITLGQGNKVEAPGMVELMIDEVNDMLKGEDTKKLEKDWQEHHKEICKVCNGSGYDPEDKVSCFGCEGSGIDFEVHYGCYDGQPKGYVVAYGLDFFKEMCKAHREAEDPGMIAKGAWLRPFMLPHFLKIELMSRGYPVDDMLTNNNGIRELANVVSNEYPEFMTTNLKRF